MSQILNHVQTQHIQLYWTRSETDKAQISYTDREFITVKDDHAVFVAIVSFVDIFFIWKLFLHNSQTVDGRIYTTRGPEQTSYM